MVDISIFRLLIAVAAIVCIFLLFNLLKNRRIIGSEFLIWISLLLLVIFLCIFPSTITIIFNYISFSSDSRYDRLIQLGYLFSFSSLAIIFYYRSKIHLHREQFIKSIQIPLLRRFISENIKKIGKLDLIILIPAYNEEGVIHDVIKKIPDRICGFEPLILVVSDGSDDSTISIAKKAGAYVVVHPINLGQCVAYRTGYMIANKMCTKYLIHLDADGQYKPEEIDQILKPIVDGEVDLVSGSRKLGYYEEEYKLSNLPRSIGVIFFNYLLTILLGTKITDSASGFRAIRADFLPMLTLKQEQFHSSELLIESIKKGARFKEVPVSFLGRQSGFTKKPNSVRYAFGFINAIIRTWMRN